MKKKLFEIKILEDSRKIFDVKLKEDKNKLTNKYTYYFVLNEDVLRTNVNNYTKIGQVYYPLKSNSSDVIIEELVKLYEGTNFHGEGLASIIKDIWNLGVNVDLNYMPTYLDSAAVTFLFQKANQSIEINKIRQKIFSFC